MMLTSFSLQPKYPAEEKTMSHTHPISNPNSGPVTNLVTYYPKPGRERELRALVESHYPVLRRTGLATEMPARIWDALDIRSGQRYFVELFQWKNEEASSIAHQTPEVMAVWEPMGPVMENMIIAKLDEVPSGDVG